LFSLPSRCPGTGGAPNRGQWIDRYGRAIRGILLQHFTLAEGAYVPAGAAKTMSSTKMRAGTELLIDLAPILKILCKSETFIKAQAIRGRWRLTNRPKA